MTTRIDRSAPPVVSTVQQPRNEAAVPARTEQPRATDRSGFQPPSAQAPVALGSAAGPHVPLPNLSAEPEAQTLTGTASPQAAIGDNSKVESTIRIDGAVGVQKLSVDLGLAHSYRGDLTVFLTSPSGKTVVLSDRAGGSADDLRGVFPLEGFEGESSVGEWKLTVEDKARGDVGTLERWSLEIAGEPIDGPPPPPPPASDDSDPMKHLQILASDEMQGRDSPSAGYDKASGYVRDFLQQYGLKGPNPTDSQSPYFQTFDVFNFDAGRSVQEHEEPHSLDPKDFNHTAFELGHYLDDSLGPDQLKVLNQKYRETVQEQGVAPSRGSGPNGDLTVDELRAVSQRAGNVQNVMGLIEGTGPNKDEVLVVMAHLDHVGVNSKGQVFNGADDNASGSATLMASIPELMQLQKEGKLDRSILFLFTAAEEQGLVGSQYFVDHPIPGLGLKEISGVVNMDMVGRWDDQRLSVLDTTKGKANYFRDVLETANSGMADPFDVINRDIGAFANRQDGASFSKKGEDVLMLFEGLSNPKGGGQLNPDYHGTGDDVDKILKDNGGNKPRRVKDLFVQIVKGASNHALIEETDTRRRAAAPPPSAVVWR